MYIAIELEQNRKILPEQKKLVEKIADTPEEKAIFSFPRRLVETKAYRKDAMYFGCFVFDKLCGEIGRRLGITVDQVRYMTRQELFDALAGKFNDFGALKKRIEYSVFFAINGRQTILVGEEARKWYKENVKTEKISGASEITGTPAFAGHAIGRVKVINHPNEMLKMQKGDILVSHATNPNLLPAMTKAAAIVTDVGGLTCHAAIVSREFRIPCVVGTKIATQVLKDGDLVEVDAESGIIRKKKAPNRAGVA
jgi:phosphohistidine swiveling domain-containing protein